MIRKTVISFLLLVSIELAVSCSHKQTSQTPAPDLPNPASVYCEQNGGELDLRQDAEGGVVGICVFADGSECDEWAYFRGECAPASQGSLATAPAGETPPHPTEIPTALPIDSADYQGWWTYTHEGLGFSIMVPDDWAVEGTTQSDPLMKGHLLMLHPKISTGAELNIRMTFRNSGDDVPLWPTGVGAGEFISQGILEVASQRARRILFVCPTGQVNEIWYHGAEETNPNIQIEDMEFGFIAFYSGVYCQEGYSIDGKMQRVGEMIIASLNVAK